MSSKAIKVSENTYNHLKKISEEKKISIKEIVDRMSESSSSIEDFRGSWEITDRELEEIRRERKELWENWEL